MKIPLYQVPSLSAQDVPVLNNILMRMAHAINSIEFGSVTATENVWCTFLVVDGGAIGECCSASHTLRRKPTGTIVVWQDAAAIMYKPTAVASADTTEQVFYIFNTASVSAVLLLI